MKTIALSTIIAVFLLLFAKGIQAQTETQSIKLMNALIEADCNNSNGIVNSVEDVDFAGQGNISLLMYGSLNGCTEVVKALLDKGAKIDGLDDDRWTALICASMKGHNEIIELLLDRGATLDWRDKEGFTALMIASQFGHSEVVKLLLERGAKIDLQMPTGITALIIASANGKTEVVKLLLEKGANAELKTIEGKTAYDYAANSEIKTLLSNYKNK
jgi:uncharacterized protein